MKKIIPTLLTMASLLGIAAILVYVIDSTEPKAQRETATKKTAMLVDVEKVSRGTYHPRIEGLGTVEASKDITLSPRIGGRVIGIDANFIPGSFVSKGQILLQIDPVDFQILVQQRQSSLAQAKAQLDIELGRREVAEKEFDLLDQKVGSANRSLVLREPQLASAKAAVAAAEAQLRQAKLDLQRTDVTAPFDAQIVSRNVNIGSEIDPDSRLARLAGIDVYWVIATVPAAQLERISFPAPGEKGAMVTIRNRGGWPEGVVRQGHVVRLIGALDQQTRLARVLVEVEDPLSLRSSEETPKMLIGAIVQTEIKGSPLDDVFRIDRDYLREGDRLLLNRDGKLAITQASVVFKDKEFAYIDEGLENGDLLVKDNLATVAEGILLRTESDSGIEPKGDQE